MPSGRPSRSPGKVGRKGYQASDGRQWRPEQHSAEPARTIDQKDQRHLAPAAESCLAISNATTPPMDHPPRVGTIGETAPESHRHTVTPWGKIPLGCRGSIEAVSLESNDAARSIEPTGQRVVAKTPPPMGWTRKSGGQVRGPERDQRGWLV